MPHPLQFLTQKEVAIALRVSERTLERWRVEGKGPPFVLIGRKPLYRPDDLAAHAEKRTYQSTSEAKAAGCEA